MFAMEVLFKFRLSISKKKEKLLNTNFEADDIDKTIGIHTVFITASPVLTNEI